MATLPDFPPFDINCEPTSLGISWKKWITRLENLFVALDIQSEERRKALLLYYGGEDLSDIFSTLCEEADTTYKLARVKLDAHFEPKVNLTYETYNFRKLVQEEGESIDKFVTRLKESAARCQFHDASREIKDQVVQKCLSERLRRKALRDDPSLEALLKAARAMELSEAQASVMEKESNINKIRKPGKYSANYKSKDKDSKNSKKEGESSCFNCGNSWPHKGGQKSCPAHGKDCDKCGRKNHFARMCKNKPTNAVEASCSSDSDDSYSFEIKSILKKEGRRRKKEKKNVSFKIKAVKGKKVQTYTKVHISDVEAKMQIDSGADVNTLTEGDYEKVKSKVTLVPTRAKLYAYGSTKPLELLGKFTATVSSKKAYDVADFYVVRGPTSGGLLGVSTATALGLLKLNVNQTGKKVPKESTNVFTKRRQRNVADLVKQYNDVFNGIGKMKGVKVKLDIDKTVEPVAQRHRRVPFHLREKLEMELDRLEEAGVIEKVNAATGWVSPLVITPKKGTDDIRMCVDMVQANKAIKRVRHVIPTVEELRHEMNGMTVFSKLDLNNGFHQLELDEESRNITTFSSHKGLARYCRLNFGTNSAPEIFHEELRKKLMAVQGVRNIHDDIFVAGVDHKDHYRALKECLEVLRQNGLTAKKSKCEFAKPSIKFFGLIFSSKGVHPDPEKVEALKAAEPPRSKKELRSFLGMTNFTSQFMPNYANITYPLRMLLRKHCQWNWGEEQQTAFDKLKASLRTDTFLSYYDTNLERTEVICDASPVGLGAILVQYEKRNPVPRIVTYNSKALTDVERRYGQIEREGLAIQYSCMKNRLYLLGHPGFKVITDHKPLVSLFNNPWRPGPSRVEKIRLRLQGYSFVVEYQKGADNPTDYMSRHPLPLSTCSKEELDLSNELEAYVHWVMCNGLPKAVKIADIREAIRKDSVLQKLLKAVEDDTLKNTSDETLLPYKKVGEELSIVNDLVLRGTRIIVPLELQKKMVKLAHEGHQGLVKSKKLLRAKVWFPGMDKLVERDVKLCRPCQAAVLTPSQEPLQSSELPKGPWEHVAVDFKGPLKTGEYALVVIDEYSRYPEVEFTTSTEAKAAIPKLDKIFSTFGIPLKVKSDNGSPFQSEAFESYAAFMGFEHEPITPVYPKANGLVENFNKNIVKVNRTAVVEKKNLKQELYTFLRAYRATPHTSTGRTPAELMFQARPFRIRIPELSPSFKDEELREMDKKQKLKQKKAADKKNYVKGSDIRPGDKVLVKLPKRSKMLPVYDPIAYTVVSRRGTAVTARREKPRHSITRNTSFFKKILEEEQIDNDNARLYDDDDEIQFGESESDIESSGQEEETDEEYSETESEDSDIESCEESEGQSDSDEDDSGDDDSRDDSAYVHPARERSIPPYLRENYEMS